MACRRNPATTVPTGKGMKPLERGRGGSRTVRGVCDGAHEDSSVSTGGIREIGTGNGPPEREARERGNDEPGPKGRTRVEPMGDPRQAGTDRPLFEAPRSPIAGGAVWPRGWTIFARSCSEGRTPRARPVERHRGDPAGRKASRHMVSARTQQDREPWKARSGGSAELGCAVGAMNLERAVECRKGARESTLPKARGCLGNTLKQGGSLRKGTRLIESEGLPHDWTPRGG